MIGLKDIFRDYYSRHAVALPKDFQKREFMFELFSGRVQRYISFSTGEKVREYLTTTVPKNAYCSVCTMENPERRTGYIRADLAIDIDFPQYVSKGKYSCPVAHPKDILCDHDYSFMRQEALKVVDVLSNDFGLSKGDYYINFSGKKGFHCVVTGKAYGSMDPDERQAVVEYIMGLNIMPKQLGFSPVRSGKKWEWVGPKPAEGGWRGRSCLAVAQFIRKYDIMVKQGINGRTADILSKIEDAEKRAAAGKWKDVFPPTLPPGEVYRIIQLACQHYGPEVDMGVAKDIKRQLRIPGSIHGGSGLIAKMLTPEELADFNPYTSATIATDEMKIKLAKDIPQTPLGGETFSGKKGDIVKVPGGMGVFFVCSGVASIV